MKLTRPSATAKEFPIGALYTGKHKYFFNSETGEYRESLPAIEGSALGMQRLLLTKVPESRAVAYAERIGVFMPGAVSKAAGRNVPKPRDWPPAPALNPATGTMQ